MLPVYIVTILKKVSRDQKVTNRALNDQSLYKGIQGIDWSKYLNASQTFVIDTTIHSDNFKHSQFVSQKAKDAIVDQFREKFGQRPSIDKDFPDLRINIHIDRDQCTVSLDTSGASLHHRGYRSATNIAPINEVLAAGMLLLVPQATVWIIDPVSRYHQKVDHVPYGLAMIASNISKIGYEITKQIEKVFHLPDDLKYQKTGTLFAANLLQQAKTFRITNEDLAENMRQFVEQCVVYDALIGRKYTIQDLRQSTDLWKLVADNASPVRSFLWRDLRQEGQLGERPRIITCSYNFICHKLPS